MTAAVTVVVPTVGRPSLRTLLDALTAADTLPDAVLLVDDRPDRSTPLLAGTGVPDAVIDRVQVLAGRAAGPAVARNIGWRAASTAWIAFLDDDVVPPPNWYACLLEDIERCGDDVGATQGHIIVPLPEDRRPTDWVRNVHGLEDARWATADMAYRREALAVAGGFDERFPRAYREDADLGLRVTELGWRIVTGERWVRHPVRPADPWVSVRLQRGNADDVLMRVVHGPDWRQRAGVPTGRRRRHLLVTASLAAGAVGLVARSPRLARAGLVGYGFGVAEFAWARIAPGPRTADEIGTMLATSAVLPLAASRHWLAGWVRVRRLVAEGGPVPDPLPTPAVRVLT